MRRPFCLMKAEPGKGGMIGGEFDPCLELDGGLAAAAGQIFGRLHQPPANPLPLAVRGDGELADIKTVSLFASKKAADDPVAVE